MAVTGKTKAEESEVKVEAKVEEQPSYPPVKQMVRWLSKSGFSNPDEGYMVAQEVDLELGTWYADGYRLRNTHYLGENPEAFGVLYVLVKNV